MTSFEALLLGAVIYGGVVVGLGPQNMFVIDQALRPPLRWGVPWVCFVCDGALTVLGVYAVGSAFVSLGLGARSIALISALILLVYGMVSLRGAFAAGPAESSPESEGSPLLFALGFSLLNPYVYLDTLGIVGGTGAALPAPAQLPFLCGALLVSAFWFFGLTWGAGSIAAVAEGGNIHRTLRFGAAGLCILAAIWGLIR